MREHRAGAEIATMASRRRRFEVAAPLRRGRQGRLQAPWFDLDTRRRVCAVVAGVVGARRMNRPEVRAFLWKVTKRLGLPSDAVRRPACFDVVTVFRELPHPLRYLTLQLSVAGAIAAGAVSPRRRALLDAMAHEIGLSPSFVDERLGAALECFGSGCEP